MDAELDRIEQAEREADAQPEEGDEGETDAQDETSEKREGEDRPGQKPPK
jgi:hypothetical protein